MQTRFDSASFVEPQTIAQPSIHDIDAAKLRHALCEAIGLLMLAAALLIAHFHWNGFKLETLGNAMIEIAVVELVVVGLSFMLKEPALETIAKAVVNSVRQRLEQAEYESPKPELYMRTTNQADKDFGTAVAILDAHFRATGRTSDGESILGKTFSYDQCHKAGIVNRYQDWGRVMDLLENAGCAKDARKRGGKILAATLQEGKSRLAAHYQRNGYIWMNNMNVWLKR